MNLGLHGLREAMALGESGVDWVACVCGLKARFGSVGRGGGLEYVCF